MSEATGKLIVAKVGSTTLVDADGAPDKEFISELCAQMAQLVEEGNRVILVSSGAAAAGMERLGLSSRPSELPTLQACCAAGQAALTELYAEKLAQHDIPCGQVLLTRGDVMSRTGYLNVRNTFEALLDLGAVPVVNENDTVSATEFTFGDNDMLGAIVSVLTGADLYVILSDVEGLYTADPSKDENAELISHVEKVTPELMAMAGGSATGFGTGGMSSKVRAGRAMISAGIPMQICKGRSSGSLLAAVKGEAPGTRFEDPDANPHEGSRKLWIGVAGVARGTIVVDAGAERALLAEGASLLPVGVAGYDGSFRAGDIVNVVNDAGDLLARGIVRYSSDEVEKARGLHLDVIARFLPEHADQPLIHRDELLVF